MKLDQIFDSFTYGNVLSEKVIRRDGVTDAAFAKSAAIMLSERAVALTTPQIVRPAKQFLRQLMGKAGEAVETIGCHPDFGHLTTGMGEYHYIVSVFVDIKGSTILGTKLPLEQVRYIKDGILTTAIDIFQAFDGHIHRMQGDALFAFFGGKRMTKADAIIDALNATSVLQAYFATNLSKRFEEEGFPPIKIRIGLDFGDDDQVLWSPYGIAGTCETTTTSVHTDLAAKMQGEAGSNETMIGDNVVKYLDLPKEFYGVKVRQRDGRPVEDRYIIQHAEYRYPMWVFDWGTYLRRFAALDGPKNNYRYQAPRDFRIRCQFKQKVETDYTHEYVSNCGALPKNMDLRFILETMPHVEFDSVTWEVNNRGKEANDAGPGHVNYVMKEHANKWQVPQETRFKGHHYMKCILRQGATLVGEEYFGVYIA